MCETSVSVIIFYVSHLFLTLQSQHAALPDLDNCTSFFGVYDGHGGNAFNLMHFLEVYALCL